MRAFKHHIKIANCMEMFYQPEDTWKQTIDRFLQFAGEQGVGGEMAWFRLGKPLHQLKKDGKYDDVIGYIREQSQQKEVMWEAMHWLGAGIDGFCLTHPNESVRDFTAQCIADQCNALYEIRGKYLGAVAVVGSPFQRNLAVLRQQSHILSEEQAEENFADTLARAIRYSEGSGVAIAPERLVHTTNEKALLGPVEGEGETDVVYTIPQAAKVAKKARSKLTASQKHYVCVMVDFKAAYGSGQTPVEAYGEIPKGYAIYHAHVQAGNKLPPGYNNEGEFEGPGYVDISDSIKFLVRKTSYHDVTLSIEAFPPFDRIIKDQGSNIMEGFANGNKHLRRLIKKAL